MVTVMSQTDVGPQPHRLAHSGRESRVTRRDEQEMGCTSTQGERQQRWPESPVPCRKGRRREVDDEGGLSRPDMGRVTVGSATTTQATAAPYLVDSRLLAIM